MVLVVLDSKLIYYDGIVCEGWISFRFILIYKVIFVIIQDCIGDSEQGL